MQPRNDSIPTLLDTQVSVMPTPRPSGPVVSLVIVNWNGGGILRRCLESILSRTSYEGFSVIVVDNGSTDGSVEMVIREFPTVQLIRNRKNLGFAGGNNCGFRLAMQQGVDYVLLLNNDVEIIQHDWLTRMIGFAEANCQIGILGPRLIYPNGAPQASAVSADSGTGGMLGIAVVRPNRIASAVRVLSIRGSALLIRAKLFSTIGLLDEGYNPAFFEDDDYCFRARRAGYEVVYYPEVTVIHRGAASTSRLPVARVVFLGYRNMIRFAAMNLGGSWIVSCFMWLIVSAFFERKDAFTPIRLSNVKLRRSLGLHIWALAAGLYVGLRSLPQLLHSRWQRSSLDRTCQVHRCP